MNLSTSIVRKYVFMFVQFFLFMSFAKAETKNFTINLPKAYLTKSEIVSPIFYANGSGTITRTANLTSFTACQGVASSTQTITISASSLNASTTVNLTAPTGFEISGTSTGTYSTSLVFAQTSAGTLTTTTVFIRLSASASAGTYSGSLSIASDGANQDLLLSMPSSTVTSLPTVSPITGSLSLCINGSTTLTNSTSGGTWTSSATGIANINTSTGLVQALSAGNVTMTYTVRSGVNSACTNSATAVMVVTAPPTVNAIAGTFSTCIGGTTTLTNATTGGTWSSSAIGIATINATTGLVQGVAAGNATITYTVASGVNSACTSSVTAIVAVNALPTIGTIDPIANVLTNATSFSVTIPSTTGSPDRFSITAGTPVLASFVAVTDGAISGTGTSTSINITLPTSKTAGNYDLH